MARCVLKSGVLCANIIKLGALLQSVIILGMSKNFLLLTCILSQHFSVSLPSHACNSKDTHL